MSDSVASSEKPAEAPEAAEHAADATVSDNPATVAGAADSPSMPARKSLTRDQRIQITTIRGLGHTYEFIAAHLGVTMRQVQYACQAPDVTPKHKEKSGRLSKLTTAEVDDLVEFVTKSKKGRDMTYKELAGQFFPDGRIGKEVIRRALIKRGLPPRVGPRTRKPDKRVEDAANEVS